ncbi:MAG: RluA family pseudouridine synthase [Pseudodesulfovibrio sp.]|uniref:Pseudouridine synthase n=1 Tax=Pseudodesulfovibrio aespoeensis (strain ATCC 700646 / DSM 10631 / Aspo-2) TaxID=643562 RepID=E6VWR5_PSEA9|nr:MULTISPECIES: RluA family pseudouridine synthase [Pseudodesulfovibrio]MBU4192999.1 RluA family pseudouridine synthase [Pseudomonadota bacterium]ADU63677.1 pseudouridine synthase [Pseudodesulfovibrio aespoeensis Aspo-2]MBU4244960.1 RluA family pseudouridine synthase [Pseudomonadota bacterium]MBU4378050.1 RluA family pseudouridine synthase [Pseudomonadota bacterium]MBU4476331.1 RluA family pseudouridine synthase [Pseudomonadota bacterium]
MTGIPDGLVIVHRDPLFVVVDKPGGLLSVPGRGPENQDCVVNRLKALLPECLDQPSVHRLDQDTSGLLVLALTAQAHRALSVQFMERLVGKRYVALIDGVLGPDSGIIELAFRLDPDNRPYHVYDPEQGKPGVTRWRKLGVEQGRTRVEFMPLTGRTHQLRLHSAHEKGLGHPIVGDRLYGTGTAPGQLRLHASALRFRHPATRQNLEFFSLPPF